MSLSDSGGDDDDNADDASSSLLPRELRKSSSIGILHQQIPKRQHPSRGPKKRNAGILLPRNYSKRENFFVTHGQTD